jgi:hypothetical protein
MAIEAKRAGIWFDQSQQQAGDGAFSGAGFADDAECLAAFNVEGDVVDYAAWHLTATHGIGFDEMVDFNQGHDGGALRYQRTPVVRTTKAKSGPGS